MAANNSADKDSFREVLEIFSGNSFIDWRNPPGEFAASSEQIIQSLFNCLFEIKAFDFVVVAVPKGGISSVFNGDKMPSFCLSENLAKEQLAIFVKHALKGHELIVSIACDFEKVSYVFERAGWQVSRERKNEIFDDINRNWQKEATAIVSKFCAGGAFFFGHDADPIYFLGRR